DSRVPRELSLRGGTARISNVTGAELTKKIGLIMARLMCMIMCEENRTLPYTAGPPLVTQNIRSMAITQLVVRSHDHESPRRRRRMTQRRYVTRPATHKNAKRISQRHWVNQLPIVCSGGSSAPVNWYAGLGA